MISGTFTHQLLTMPRMVEKAINPNPQAMPYISKLPLCGRHSGALPVPPHSGHTPVAAHWAHFGSGEFRCRFMPVSWHPSRSLRKTCSGRKQSASAAPTTPYSTTHTTNLHPIFQVPRTRSLPSPDEQTWRRRKTWAFMAYSPVAVKLLNPKLLLVPPAL
jgi:hypothetical protein